MTCWYPSRVLLPCFACALLWLPACGESLVEEEPSDYEDYNALDSSSLGPQALESASLGGADLVDLYITSANLSVRKQKLVADQDVVTTAKVGDLINLEAVPKIKEVGRVDLLFVGSSEMGRVEHRAPYQGWDGKGWRVKRHSYVVEVRLKKADGSYVRGANGQAAKRVMKIHFAKDQAIKLDWYNATTDKRIGTLGDQSEINLNLYGDQLNVDAIPTRSDVDAVSFELDHGLIDRAESKAPYFMAGHHGQDLLPWKASEGGHVLVTKALDAAGQTLSARVTSFQALGSGSSTTASGPTPPPAPFLPSPGTSKNKKTTVLASSLRQFRSTMNSISVEWDLSGDSNHNATSTLFYRKKGSSSWTETLGLQRIDYVYDRPFGYNRVPGEPESWNMVAGSVMFLKADTEYEVRMRVKDPDGGAYERVESIRTRPDPTTYKAPASRTFYVSTRGCDTCGDGSKGDPYSLDQAMRLAGPGDLFLLGDGHYGAWRLDGKDGQLRKPIVWRARNRHGARFSEIKLHAAHQWLDGFAVTRDSRREDKGGVSAGDRLGSAPFITLTYLKIRGFKSSIATNHQPSNAEPKTNDGWVIMDNDLSGTNDPKVSDFSGEGVVLQSSNDHVVAHNLIRNVADGISAPRRNCDIYGNDIQDTADDGIELDFAYANNRVWENRVRSPRNFSLSFQYQAVGPWYWVRNDVQGGSAENGGVFKFNGKVDRNVWIHNTFAVDTTRGLTQAFYAYLMGYSRNNLFWVDNQKGWRFQAKSATDYLPDSSFYALDWRTDVSHDGLYSEDTSVDYFGTTYNSLEAFGKSRKQGTFGPLVDLVRGDLSVKADAMTLPSGSGARGAGTSVFDFTTSATPDLGAHQRGAALPHYGPRP